MTTGISTHATEADTAVSLHYDIVRALRSGLGIPEDVAVPLARHIARELMARLGGLYIPKRELRAERDAAIRAAFTGRNHADLAKLHRVSVRTIYNILQKP